MDNNDKKTIHPGIIKYFEKVKEEKNKPATKHPGIITTNPPKKNPHFVTENNRI